MLPRLMTAVLLTTLVGCASSQPHPATAPTTRVYAEPAYCHPATASALVFDPPSTRLMPPLDLSRDGRYPAAFAGFQQATNTTSFTWTDDRQSTEFLDSYDRHTISVQVGTSVR